MKTRLVAAALIVVPSLASAHDSTDWRMDREAFRSARVVPPASVSSLRLSRYERFPMDPSYLKQKVSELSGAVPVQIDGKSVVLTERGTEPNKKLARGWLKSEYEALGFQVSLHEYPFGFNLVAEKAGSDPSKVLILSSHLDSVRNAGADDNGTGTITALAVARVLSRKGFKHTLRVIAFDQEEQGLIGSRRYVESLSQPKNVLGVINMEMTAYQTRDDGGFHVIDCDRAESSFLTTSIMEAVQALELPLLRVAACTNRSDHASFWRRSIPAVVVAQNFFGGDGNPCYHQSCDKIDGLDFEYMAKISEAVASASAKLLLAD